MEWPLRGGIMKKVLFLVAFLSLVGVSRVHGAGNAVDVTAPEDVKVTIEKVHNQDQVNGDYDNDDADDNDTDDTDDTDDDAQTSNYNRE